MQSWKMFLKCRLLAVNSKSEEYADLYQMHNPFAIMHNPFAGRAAVTQFIFTHCKQGSSKRMQWQGT
jgi:hypothetical protein